MLKRIILPFIIIFTAHFYAQSWIAAVDPPPNSLNVDEATAINITFTEDIDPTTLTNNTIKVNGSLGGLYRSSNIIYHSGSKTAVFNPDSHFMAGEFVNITLTTGIQNVIGDSMPAPHNWGFVIRVQNGTAVFENLASIDVGQLAGMMVSGDWDNDGDVDLAVANAGIFDSITLLFNDGQGGFTPTVIDNLENSDSVIAGDWDGDGDLDFAVFNQFSYDVMILKNDGSGNFTLFSNTHLGAIPHFMSCGDWDGDGDLDLVVLKTYNDELRILMNDGSGIFTHTSTSFTGIDMNAVTSGDWDGDGDLDLALTLIVLDSVAVLTNDGGGGFIQTSTLATGEVPYNITNGDWDGDGDLDLAVTNWGSDSISILNNDGSGSFAQTQMIATDNRPQSIIAGDFDNDGNLDLAVGNNGFPEVATLSILLNNGNGSFAPFSTTHQGIDLFSLAPGDFNGDGSLDLAAGDIDSAMVFILRNKPLEQNISLSKDTLNFGVVDVDSTESLPLEIYNTGVGVDLQISNIISSNPVFTVTPTGGVIPPNGSLMVTVSFSPANGIPYTDSLTILSDDPQTPVSMVKLQGSGSLVHSVFPPQNALNVQRDTSISITFTEDLNPATLSNSTIRVAGSLSGFYTGSPIIYNSPAKTALFDPDTSFKVGEEIRVTLTTGIRSAVGDTMPAPYQWGFTVQTLNGNGEFTNHGNPGVGDAPAGVHAGDFDGDEDLDVAVVNSGANTLSILSNDGNGNFSPATTTGVGNQPASVTSGDYDNDGDLDLAVANQFSHTVSILINAGNGSFSQASTPGVGNEPVSVISGDVDGDGDLDLVTANFEARSISLLLNNGSSSFTPGPTVAVGNNPTSVTSGDFDGDRHLDLAVTNEASGTVSILMNDGQGNFIQTSAPGVGSNPKSVAAGDFDGDGDIDLAAANKGSGTLSILFNDGNGGFSEVSVSPMFSVPISVTGGDVDADGDLDLAVANLRAGTSSILSNNGNGSFTPHSVSTVEDFPRSIAAGDFDDNGSLDLAVANFGSNTISILLNGSIVQIADDMPALPRRFALHQNVPNPFNPTTAIKYDLPKPARVKLEVFNILGQRVITLVNHLQSADYYTVQWNGINTSGVKVGSGMYIYRLTAEATDGSETFTEVKKMLLVR